MCMPLVVIIWDNSGWDQRKRKKYEDCNIYVPTLIPNMTNIISISTKYNHSLLLTDDGQVYGFGSNNTQEVYYSPVFIWELQDIIQISGGVNQSSALDVHGRIFSLGYKKK